MIINDKGTSSILQSEQDGHGSKEDKYIKTQRDRYGDNSGISALEVRKFIIVSGEDAVWVCRNEEHVTTTTF